MSDVITDLEAVSTEAVSTEAVSTEAVVEDLKSIKSYWHHCTNFGDALTPYLIEKISGEKAKFVPDNSDPSLVMVTGSLLSYNVKSGIVWGSGSAFTSDLDPTRFSPPSEDFRIIATRGLLSKNLVKLSGHEPVAIGDPGLLLPRFYTPNVSKKYDVGIMVSWVDYYLVSEAYSEDDGITIINSMGDIENIINRICECETLITSTLHGLVAAVAYGIPTVSVKFSNKMVGDGFKYQDFLSCTEKQYQQIDLREMVSEVYPGWSLPLTKNELMKLAFVHKLSISIDDLLNCCPFRKQQDD